MKILLQVEPIRYFSILNEAIDSACGMLVLGGVLLAVSAAAAVSAWQVYRDRRYRKENTASYIAVAFTALLIAVAVLRAHFRLMYDIRNNPDKMVIEQLLDVPEE